MIFLALGLVCIALIVELIRLWVWKKLPFFTLSLLISGILGILIYLSAVLYVQLEAVIRYQQFIEWYLAGKPGYMGQETEIF